jgi:hypothetical protein
MCANGLVKVPGQTGSENQNPILFHQPRQLVRSSERYGLSRILDFHATPRYESVAIPDFLRHNDSAKSVNSGSHGNP